MSNKPVIPALAALGIALIALKLCDVIDWPWWLVTLPLCICLSVLALWLFVFFAIAIIKAWRG